jgi:hypothetical protein
VDAMFAQLELPSARQERIACLVSQHGPLVDAIAESHRLNARIARARQGLLDGVLDTATTKAAITDAEAGLARLVETPHAAIAAVNILTNVSDLWPHMTDEEKHKLILLVPNEAVVDLRTGNVTNSLPKTSFAPLFQVLTEEEGGLISFCGWRPRRDSNPPSIQLPHGFGNGVRCRSYSPPREVAALAGVRRRCSLNYRTTRNLRWTELDRPPIWPNRSSCKPSRPGSWGS